MGTLLLTTDFGATWTTKASPPTIFSNIQNLAVDPNVSTMLIAATADGLFKSTDGAASWTRTVGSGSPFSVEGHFPFVLMNHQCNPGGGLFAIGSGIGSYGVAFSPDYGSTWTPPHLTDVTSVVAGPVCAVYATRTATSDPFVAKLAPDGRTIWATFLGGSDRDVPAGLAVDTQGNAYVTGTTASLDFPSSAPRIGLPGQNSVFVAMFRTDGTLAYSVLIGGEANNSASAVAVDPGQNAYVVGSTNSARFPVTPGPLATTLNSGSYSGFLVKLSSGGNQLYGTYLSGAETFANAITVGTDESPVLAGLGALPGLSPPPQQGTPSEFLIKLDRTASQAISETYIQGAYAGTVGPRALVLDPSGNLFVMGDTGGGTDFTITPGAYGPPPSSSGCGTSFYYQSANDAVYLTKLRAADWQPLYRALLTAPCGIRPGSMEVDSAGSVVLGLSTGSGFALHGAVLAGPTCSFNSSVVAKLSPDGSALQFATYLDSCGAPAIALAQDGAVYAGATSKNEASVLRVDTTIAPAISLDRISNAFSGDANVVVGGGLYTLTASGFQAPFIDLGLNPSQPLPTQLGGVRVTFNGVPAAILQTAPGRAIVVPPWRLTLRENVSGSSAQRLYLAEVRLFYNGAGSNAVWVPVSTSLPGLLTSSFPNPQPSLTDANARNQDGTLNDAAHPAVAGSSITLFATGLGATEPRVAFNSIANSAGVVPSQPIYSTWQPKTLSAPSLPIAVYSVPGFVSAMFQIPIQVPNALPAGFGMDVGDGVRQVPIGLLLAPPPISSITIPASNVVAVYVR